MKKILLGTTAIVAATAISAGVAKAEMSMNGFMYQGFGMVIDSDKGENVDGGLSSYQNAGLNFVGSAELDNGMTMSAIFDFDADNDKGTIDEMRFSLSDDWGTLQLGGDDTAADVMNVSAWNVVTNAVNSGVWTQYVAASTAVWGTGFMATSGSLIGDDASIKYYSPDMNGVSFGVSYAPNTDGNTGAGGDSGFNNIWSAGLKLSTDMEAASVTAGLGVEFVADSNLNVPLGADDDIVKWNAGVQVGVGSFGINLGYTALDYNTSTTAKVDNWTLATSATYSSGPHSVGIMWVTGETATGTAANDQDGDAYQLGYALDLGSGVYWDASLSMFDVEDGAAGNNTTLESDFTVFETGVGVSF